MTCRPMPWGGPAAVSDARGIDKTGSRAIAEAARTLSDDTEGRKQDQVVVERDAVPSEPLRPESQRGAEGRSDNGHRVDPVDLLDPRVVLMRFQVRKLCWRERRRHLSCRVESRSQQWSQWRGGARLKCDPALYMVPEAAAGAYADVEQRARAAGSMRSYRASMSRSLARRGCANAMRMQRGWRRGRLGMEATESHPDVAAAIAGAGSAIFDFARA
jgi:hypothetical protein